ncbi:MAG TPA: hypothetical protein VHA76_02115 [Solirubrobacterales bacterium]|nr:hypothetical protein [Solirubrobacterales bacterium]
MRARLRDKLTYANVMATIAVFAALGGASYAATALPKNSVGTAQLRKGAVTGAKIGNGAVTTAKLAAGAVTGSKVNLSSLGTVPSAAHASSADSATNAAHADSAGTAASADHAAQADSAAHATQADSATHAESATRAESAADADALDGLPASAFQTRGYESATNPTYTFGPLAEVRSIEIPVGAEPHHVLIVADAQVQSNGEEVCGGFIGLEWDGTEQETTYAGGTAPTIEHTNGWESVSTSAAPLLPAGTQKITLLGGAETGCRVENGRLTAVVLGN